MSLLFCPFTEVAGEVKIYGNWNRQVVQTARRGTDSSRRPTVGRIFSCTSARSRAMVTSRSRRARTWNTSPSRVIRARRPRTLWSSREQRIDRRWFGLCPNLRLRFFGGGMARRSPQTLGKRERERTSLEARAQAAEEGRRGGSAPRAADRSGRRSGRRSAVEESTLESPHPKRPRRAKPIRDSGDGRQPRQPHEERKQALDVVLRRAWRTGSRRRPEPTAIITRKGVVAGFLERIGLNGRKRQVISVDELGAVWRSPQNPCADWRTRTWCTDVAVRRRC